MSLRRRLVLTIVATAVPLVALGVWLRIEGSRRAWQQAYREFAAARVEQWGREACEADPADPPERGFRRRPRPDGPAPEEAMRWAERRRRAGLPRTGLRIWAYDDAYRPADPDAPGFPQALKDALGRGEDAALTDTTGESGRPLVAIGLRTGWERGPCAVVLAMGAHPPDPPVGGLLTTAALLATAFLIAAWVTTGSAVRRIRALTQAVRRSSAAHYETPVGPQGSDEIGELAAAFDEATAQVRAHVGRVESREATLRSFVANTTHDVMLPLTVLQGHLAALHKAAAEGRCDPQLVQDASEEAHYMASLVHNLGAAAKLEAGEPHVERHPVDLNEVVERAVSRHRPIAGPRRVEIGSAVPEPALWTLGRRDPDRTGGQQPHPQRRPLQPARWARRGGAGAGGPTLPPARVRRRAGRARRRAGALTERRYRADDARTRSPGGQGLGLSIAREVAERHGFEMTLRRSDAGGLEVELQGPLQPS